MAFLVKQYKNFYYRDSQEIYNKKFKLLPVSYKTEILNTRN